MAKNGTKVGEIENIRSETELTKRLISISKESPTMVISASVHFGTARFYSYTSASKVPVDSPMSRCMIDTYGVIGYKNGKPVQATRGWINRNNAQETRCYNS